MKDLTLQKLAMMQSNTDHIKIITIKHDLEKQTESFKECTTIQYVFSILDRVICFNQQLHQFGSSQWVNLGLFSSKRLEFSNKIRDTVEKTLQELDLNQIHIHNAESRHAAIAISKVLQIHFITFEEEQINVKYNEVITKIALYDDLDKNGTITNDKIQKKQSSLHNHHLDIYSQQLSFRQGANRNEHRSLHLVNEDASEICNTAENSSAKSITPMRTCFRHMS